jgi:hypothetical protein
MGAHVATRFFLEAPFVQPTDRHVQDRLIRRERQPIGILALIRGQVNLALRINTKHTGKAEFPLRGRQTQLRVREKNAAVGATHDIVGFIEPFAVPAFGNGRDRAGRIHAGNAPVIRPFTHEQPPLAIEGAAVPLARLLRTTVTWPVGSQRRSRPSARSTKVTEPSACQSGPSVAPQPVVSNVGSVDSSSVDRFSGIVDLLVTHGRVERALSTWWCSPEGETPRVHAQGPLVQGIPSLDDEGISTVQTRPEGALDVIAVSVANPCARGGAGLPE